MRQFTALIAAFTIGALFATVLAERKANEQNNALRQENADLRVDLTYADNAMRCNEDEPCWDCKTMGNRVCGSKGK